VGLAPAPDELRGTVEWDEGSFESVVGSAISAFICQCLALCGCYTVFKIVDGSGKEETRLLRVEKGARAYIDEIRDGSVRGLLREMSKCRVF
jgi:hypothetical protein